MRPSASCSFGAPSRTPRSTSSLREPGFYLGGIFYAASFGTFLASLRHFEVLTVFPLFSGLAYATVAVAAAVVLDESLTVSRVVGIVLVGVGAFLLVR